MSSPPSQIRFYSDSTKGTAATEEKTKDEPGNVNLSNESEKVLSSSKSSKSDDIELIKSFVEEQYGDERTKKDQEPFQDLIKSLDILEDFELQKPKSDDFEKSLFKQFPSKNRNSDYRIRNKDSDSFTGDSNYEDMERWLESLDFEDDITHSSSRKVDNTGTATELGFVDSKSILSLLKDEHGYEEDRNVDTGKKARSDEFFKGIFKSAFTTSVPSGRSQFEKLIGFEDMGEKGPRYIYKGRDSRGSSRMGEYSYTDRINAVLRKEFFEKVADSFGPTRQYIEKMQTPVEVMNFYRSVIERWISIRESNTEEQAKIFELLSSLKENKTLSLIHEEYIENLAEQTLVNEKEPPLNIFTLPVIFNTVLKTLAFKHHDGQLALSLYNMLKSDISLYTVICNQKTYNEILKILAVYFGKSDLYSIEMAFMEMKNNGFSGDSATFNILSLILSDYHKLSQEFSTKKRTTLSSKEDEMRADNLYRGLKFLQNSLRIEP
ncbi:hypothetical protein G9P44_001182 [Scheffersomyces stipitis]|nr:hypothetical protein G9P44_001182 [Scheffersomyces stipitis]